MTAKGDIRIRRSPGPRAGVSKEDRRRWEAQRRRDDKARFKVEQERQDILSAMTLQERQKFIADEKAQAEHERELSAQRLREANEDRNEQLEALRNDARQLAGYMLEDIHTTVRLRERNDQDSGEWLDDPVTAITEGVGFGEMESYRKGTNLQVNLALDCSTSMYANDLHTAAVNAFRTIYWSLQFAMSDLPMAKVRYTAWLWAKNRDGKGVLRLSEPPDSIKDIRGAMRYAPSDWGLAGWTGEDTWLYPLLEAFEQDENKKGDFDAARLDIVITDGVLEHPTDSRRGDVIQEQRNGNLQTVVLNFLPMDEWGDYRLPNRCTQREVTTDNLLAVIQSAIADWLADMG